MWLLLLVVAVMDCLSHRQPTPRGSEMHVVQISQGRLLAERDLLLMSFLGTISLDSQGI